MIRMLRPRPWHCPLARSAEDGAVDEAMLMRGASRDRWCVAVRTDMPERAHELLRALSAEQIEEVAA